MAQPHSPPVLKMTDVVLTTVQPLHKTAHVETIDPTFMDLPTADWYISVFFAYRLEDKSEAVYSQAVKRIKGSLRKVLVPFFSFAGRWTDVPKGSRGRKLLCNDEGVPLIEANVDKDLDSVVQASAAFQPVPELQGFELVGLDVEKVKQDMLPDGLPPIFVQITRFKCGGLVLAVTFNHMHTDARGFFNFMAAWSDISRTNVTAVEVDQNRAQVDIPAMKGIFSNLGFTETVSSDGAAGGGAPPTEPPKPKPWGLKVYEVEASVIKALKQEAKGSEGGGGYVTTGDSIVAHIWRSFAGLPSSLLGDRDLAVGQAVEGRNRFYDPPLPHLCGNVVLMLPSPDVAVKKVRDMPLLGLANLLRHTVKTTKREDWLDLERMAKMQDLWGNHVASLDVTSWLYLPVYEMDFGFGKPYFFSGPNIVYPLPSVGTIYIGPAIPHSSSVAIVYLTSTLEVLEALERNPHFSAVFSGELHHVPQLLRAKI